MKKRCFITVFVFLALCLNLIAETKNGTPESKNAKAAKKNYIGWVDANTRDVSFNKGILRFTVKPNLGSYNISVVNNKDRVIPVLSTIDEFTSTYFYLKTSKKTYKLRSENKIRTGFSKSADGLSVIYSIENVADVEVKLECIQSSIDRDFDTVKTTINITNKSNKRDDFAVKQIIDTVLGESGAYHFYTADDTPVKNEIMYRNMKEQKWYTSKNNSAAMQLVFRGADATEPEIVALANYATLSKSGWEPDMLSFRTFDTVLSYNNSGVGVIWPSLKIMPKETKKIVYYSFFATDGENPNGEEYIYGKAVPEDVEPAEPEVIEVPAPLPVVAEKEQKTVQKKESFIFKSPREESYSPKEIPNMEFNVESLSREQFSPEYIQSLLDRIAVLERNSSSVNREELLRLNTELDAILSALRQ